MNAAVLTRSHGAVVGSGGGGGGGGSSRAPVEAPNTLRSKAIYRMLLAVSEGEIEGLVDGEKSIYYGDTPLMASDGTYNFSGVTWYERKGTPDQDPIPGFPAAENEVTVNADVTNAIPVTRSLQDGLDAVRVRIQLSALYKQNTKNGDINPSSVTVAIERRREGEDWEQVVEDKIEGKTMTTYERAYRVELDRDYPHDVRVLRVTEDIESSYQADAVSWAGYTEIIDHKFIYPDTAIYGFVVDPEEFGDSVESASVRIRGIKVQVPSNYDPVSRAYTGIWDGTFQLAWTNNPAWILYDLIVNERYGLGQFIPASWADKWELYLIAQRCDEMVPDGFGGQEPRYTFNYCIRTARDALNCLSLVAGIAQTMIYWGSGAVAFAQDRPMEPSHIANQANVEDGIFEYSTTKLKNRPTVVVATWNDPDDMCRAAVEVVPNDEAVRLYGWKPKQVAVIGCTSRGLCVRHAKGILEAEWVNTNLCGWNGGLDFADAMPGSVVQVEDPETSGVRWGGRLKTGTTASRLLLDAPVTLESGELYVVSAVLPDGTSADGTVVFTPGETEALDLAEPLADAPQAGALWALSSGSLQLQQFRVLGVTEEGLHKYQVACVNYDPNKWDRIEQGLQFDDPVFSRLSPNPPPRPSNLTVAEYLVMEGSAVDARAVCSWQHTASPTHSFYQAQVQRPGLPWETVATTGDASAVVAGVDLGLHSFRVRSVSRTGRVGAWLLLEGVFLYGIRQPMDDVEGLTVLYVNGQQHLDWSAVTDLRPVSYQIRRGADWATAQILGTTTLTRFAITGPGIYQVRAKSGRAYSSNSAQVVVDGYGLVANVVAEHDHKDEGWPGTCSGGAAVVGDEVWLVAQGDVYDIPDVYDVPDIRFYGGVAATGTYTIPAGQVVELDTDTACNVNVSLELRARGVFNDVYSWPNVYDVADVFGGLGEFVEADPQINIYREGEWQGWQTHVPGQIVGQKFNFRVVLITQREDVIPVLEEFVVFVDVPDRTQRYQGMTIPATGYHLTYSEQFNVFPALVAQVLDAQGGEDVEITNQTKAGCDIKVKSGGSYVERVINVIAQGY